MRNLINFLMIRKKKQGGGKRGVLTNLHNMFKCKSMGQDMGPFFSR